MNTTLKFLTGLLGLTLWAGIALADHHEHNAPAQPADAAALLKGADKAVVKGKQCPHAAAWRRHAARHHAHHQKLHDVLKLTEAQEAAWKTFTAQMAPHRHMHCGKKAAGNTAPERMEAMLGMMRRHLRQTKKRTDAVKTFYAVLTSEQQKVFDANFMPHGMGHHRHGARPKAGANAGTAAAPAAAKP
jgi:hypothetical protein